MGLRLFSSSSYDDITKSRNVAPNPSPENYKIIQHHQRGRALVVEVLYPDCTNYEGRKILLYVGTNIHQLRTQGSIDPHFSENQQYLSPVARFEPTPFGRELAMEMAMLIYKQGEPQ